MYTNANRMKKACSEFTKLFSESRALFVDFQYENSYNHILNKMVSFVNLMPETLQLLIIGLPKGATFIDTHLAETFQKMLYFKKNKDAKCLVVFIRHEDKEEIKKVIYKG